MEWLKTGRAGKKFVYNQTICGTCQGRTVKMQKLGGFRGAPGSSSGHGVTSFMSRVTFWCTVCQPSNNVNEQPSTKAMSQRSEVHALDLPEPQCCPQHGRRLMKLCRVRKGNQNHLRIFFTCKGCQYFKWADSSFGNCKCGKKAILRVSKTASTGGRWFLCCSAGDR